MDTSERQAKLNTEIRFHNYRNALPLAYGLKLELELIENRTAKQQDQLEKVRLTVKQLERLTEPLYARVARWCWSQWVEPDNEGELPPLTEEPEAAEPEGDKS